MPPEANDIHVACTLTSDEKSATSEVREDRVRTRSYPAATCLRPHCKGNLYLNPGEVEGEDFRPYLEAKCLLCSRTAFEIPLLDLVYFWDTPIQQVLRARCSTLLFLWRRIDDADSPGTGTEAFVMEERRAA